MSEPRPELIFLSGPDAGRRAVIMGDFAQIGRSPTCQVRIGEEHVSRRHVQLEKTPDGWVMEDLSGRGTRVNGRMYKTGTKVLLATGDVLGVAMATEILFVAPGDDPEEALTRCDRCHPPTDEQEDAADHTAEAADSTPTAEVKAPSPPKDSETQAKLRKYIIFGAIYIIGLVVLIVVLAGLRKDKTQPTAGRAALLGRSEIAAAVDEALPVEMSIYKAADALQEAVTLAEGLALPDAATIATQRDALNLRNCVLKFKLYLAYSGKAATPEHRQELMFTQAAARLTDLIYEDYYEPACVFERASDWRQANRLFERLLAILQGRGESPWNTPGYRALQENVKNHLGYVRGKLESPGRKKRR